MLISPHEATTWDRKAPGYQERKRRFGDHVITLAETAIPGLRSHIVYRQDGNPATFAHYAWTTNGAIYGPTAGLWQPLLQTPIKQLYLAGAGAFSGAGIEAMVISGTLVADALYQGATPKAVAGPQRPLASQSARPPMACASSEAARSRIP